MDSKTLNTPLDKAANLDLSHFIKNTIGVEETQFEWKVNWGTAFQNIISQRAE